MDPHFIKAKQDFQRARQQAKLQELVANLTGQPIDLLRFEEVRNKLKTIEGTGRELKNIPLRAIIGSVGRYHDFNRQFLPLRDEDRERWARVKLVMEDLRGLPPIEAYQVGEAYFIIDGNHRVSIARQLGATEIEGYVKTVHTRVPLSADVRQQDLILLAEYADFLEQTRLDELRPDSNLRLTEAGQYAFLLQQIEIQHFMLEMRTGTSLPYTEAVCHWHDDLYLPLVHLIRTRNLLQDFPTRTETDFFVWLLDHQAHLSKTAGWHVRAESALAELTEKIYTEAENFTQRVRNTVLDTLHLIRPAPNPAGQWREARRQQPGRLFSEIIVPLQSLPAFPLTCAIKIARHEHAQVHALYLAPLPPDQQPHLQTQFDTLCQQTDLEGQLIFSQGKPASLLPGRSRWVDLIVIQIERDSPPPAGKGTVSPAFRHLLQHCHTPLLALPPYPETTPFTFPSRALLAYDSSKRADEALFLAAYLASFWGLELVVQAVIPEAQDHPPSSALSYAEEYLHSFHIDAEYCHAHGDIPDEILRAARQHACNLILMGGYGSVPLMGGFRRRVVDDVLARTPVPVLICR